MTSFEEREKGFERKFAREEELKFKIRMLATKRIARWCAEKLGKSGKEAENFVENVLDKDLRNPGYEDVVQYIYDNLVKGSVETDLNAVNKEYAILLISARKEIEEETK